MIDNGRTPFPAGPEWHWRVCVAKANAYHAAAGALAKMGETAAAWVAVDRAITAAEDADDPLLMAEGAVRLAIVFHSARRFDLAKRTAQFAANALGRLIDAGEPEAVALRGALYLQLAVAWARTNDGEQAYAYLGRAQEAAARLGADRNDDNTEFGPTNVMLQEVNEQAGVLPGAQCRSHAAAMGRLLHRAA